jgi:cbb3-type cytochrome oxidase subunit 3
MARSLGLLTISLFFLLLIGYWFLPERYPWDDE